MRRHWRGRFPDPEEARVDGLLAHGGDLAPLTLLEAYQKGIFPWQGEGDPLLWWSPDPRCVLLPGAFRISKRSARKMRNSGFAFSFDEAFMEVMRGCALPRPRCSGTWLSEEMQAAYGLMHRLGFAHSVEIWRGRTLVGGVYGVGLGRAFFGESMFRLAPEASRAALAVLVEILRALDYSFLDCQMATPHMLAMGAANLPRRQFLEMLRAALGRAGGLALDWPMRLEGFDSAAGIPRRIGRPAPGAALP